MRYTQLRAFHHVALTGGFSRAADALNLSQPAVSEQVRSLEAEYDLRLFDRGHRTVRLTTDGERLLDITRRLFDAEHAALEMLTERRAERTGTLRIHADSAHHILHILTQFRNDHPKVAVQVSTGNSAEILTSLKAYQADIAIIGELPTDNALNVVALGASPLVAFARKGGPLDRLDAVTLTDLLAMPLVLREKGSKTRAKLELAARELPMAIEAEGREAVHEIVASGGGVGIVSQAEFSGDPRVTCARIVEPELMMQEALACLRERAGNRLIATFMELGRQAGSR